MDYKGRMGPLNGEAMHAKPTATQLLKKPNAEDRYATVKVTSHDEMGVPEGPFEESYRQGCGCG